MHNGKLASNVINHMRENTRSLEDILGESEVHYHCKTQDQEIITDPDPRNTLWWLFNTAAVVLVWSTNVRILFFN